MHGQRKSLVKRTVYAVGTLVILPLAMTTCGAQPDPDYTRRHEELLDRFGYFSRVNDYNRANAVLDELAKLPGGEAEAAYGRALTQLCDKLGIFVELLSFITTIQDAAGMAPPGGFAPEAGLTSLLHSPARKIRDALQSAEGPMLEAIEKHPTGSIELRDFAAYVGPIAIVNLNARFDRTDIHLLISIMNVVETIAGFVLTQDLGVGFDDISSIIDWFKSRSFCKPTIFDDKECLLKFGAWALQEYPDLGRQASGAAETNKIILGDVQSGFGHLVQFIDTGLAETDAPGDQLFYISREDPRETPEDPADDQFAFGIRNYRFAAFDLFLSDTARKGRRLVAAQSTWDEGGTLVSAEALEIIRRFDKHLRGDGTRIDAQDLIRPVLEMFLRTVVNAGLGADVSIIESLRSIYRSIEDLNLDPVEFFLTLVNDFLPRGMIELDFYSMAKNGIEIRSLLPEYNYLRPPDKEPYLAFDWECAFHDTNGFICIDDAVVTDKDMFAENSTEVTYGYSFEKDGYADAGPYFAFQNPDFGGVLYIDASLAPRPAGGSSLSGSEPGLRLAENREMNFILHRVTDAILELIRNAGGLIAPQNPYISDSGERP